MSGACVFTDKPLFLWRVSLVLPFAPAPSQEGLFPASSLRVLTSCIWPEASCFADGFPDVSAIVCYVTSGLNAQLLYACKTQHWLSEPSWLLLAHTPIAYPWAG